MLEVEPLVPSETCWVCYEFQHYPPLRKTGTGTNDSYENSQGGYLPRRWFHQYIPVSLSRKSVQAWIRTPRSKICMPKHCVGSQHPPIEVLTTVTDIRLPQEVSPCGFLDGEDQITCFQTLRPLVLPGNNGPYSDQPIVAKLLKTREIGPIRIAIVESSSRGDQWKQPPHTR